MRNDDSDQLPAENENFESQTPSGASLGPSSQWVPGNFHTLALFLMSGAFCMVLGVISVLLFQSLTTESRAETAHPPTKIEEQAPSYDPFDRFREMHNRFFRDFADFDTWESSFFQNHGLNSNFSGDHGQTYQLSTRETETALIYEIQLNPGVKGDSVNVAVENGLVTISGQKVQKNETENEYGQSIFATSSSFSQSFSVPNFVDSEKVKITNNNNKIVLTFPKWGQEA